ncbi:MAG: VOC family protein [Dehalococcoidia bacterium]
MITGLDHVDVIVKDFDAAIEQYKAIFGDGARFVPVEDVPGRPYRMARFEFGDRQSINILTPLDDVGPWARHLEQHGDGIYLFCLTVDDLDQTAEEMRGRGVRMPVPIGGTRVIHPASAGGALILLSQKR